MATAAALQRWLGRCAAAARTGWTPAGASTAVRVVLGNESADLDSVVSSIAYGYFAASASASQGATQIGAEPDVDCVPVINVTRRDFRLRTEVTYLFDRLGLSWDTLVFVDEVDLDGLAQQGRLALTLVDHNRLCVRQDALAPAVTAILDHHADDGGFLNAAPRLIEPVGSASTLVFDTLVRPHLSRGGMVDTAIAQLLLAPILVDTVNLDPVHKRTTAKDLAAVHTLAPLAWPAPSNNSQAGDDDNTTTYKRADDAFFHALFEAKVDTASLTVDDLLRKDYKQFAMPRTVEGQMYGIAAVPETLAAYCARALPDALDAFCIENGRLAFLLCMTFHDKPTFQRGLVIYTPSYAPINETLIHVLQDTHTDLQLVERSDLVPGTLGHRLRAFDQKNIAVSRKKLQPILEASL